MKLIIAIVHDEDANKLIDELTGDHYRVTKLATTGGFLRAGNTTLLIGVQKEGVDRVIDIIKTNCQSRKKITTSVSPVAGPTSVYIPYPVEICVGGATVFVIDVENHIKI